MIRRLIILLLIVGITTLQADTAGNILRYLLMSEKEDFKNSILPGGYIGIGISIGKTNKKDIYWDAQITGTMHIISGYQIKYVPGYTFLGFTMGKRFTNTKRMAYLDLQANLWSFIQIGYGRGWLFYDNKRIPRKKMWIGSPFPIILTFDNYILDNELVKQKGLMFSLPLPIYGKTFYPG